jgi:hypothetical protein
MKKRAKSKKGGTKKRKPIMRHSREGLRGRKARGVGKRAGSAKRKRAAKAKPKPRTATRKTSPKPRRLRRGQTERDLWPPSDARGVGAAAGGQSGDLEGLPRREDVDSESVEELVEEGQAYEAGIVSGVEEAEDRVGEVRTREVPVDDVPREYLDED